MNNRRKKWGGSIAWRLVGLFVALLVAFTLILSILYNAMLRRQNILHFSQTMQRDAYAIAQNLSELIAPSAYDSLDETRFVVSEDNLAPYLAFIEQLTNCDVYVIDTHHNVTGYFSGVIQKIENPLLPAYLEQSIALGFMGKTPFLRSRHDGETHLTACMPVMDVNSRVLGVVLLESTMREQGYKQVPSGAILLISLSVSFVLSLSLSIFFSRMFTEPISKLQKVSLMLAGGAYETRTNIAQTDEIGSLARSMDTLAQRLEEARDRDAQLRKQQQQFFSDVSHELKTPVTVIRGSLEALSDNVIRDEAHIQSYYKQMIAESRWLQRLLQDLLELSRLQNLEFSLNMEPLDLRELLGDVAMSANALCERKSIRFFCEEPRGAFPVIGDYTRLRQMLLAVVDNAIKFTPSGKSLRLSLCEDPLSIIIADEGIGIPESEVAHIFDRFRHTSDPSRESTGLGLTIVQEIAHRHGVSIDVKSCVGKGTTFSFTFPPQDADA